MDLLAYDPASGYAQCYKQQFAEAAEAFFDAAVSEGKIDTSLNAELSAKLRKLQAQKDHCSGKKGWWIFLLVLFIVIFVIWGLGIPGGVPKDKQNLHWCYFAAALVAAGAFIFFKVIPAIRRLSDRVALLQEEIEGVYGKITELLAPFYELFDWNTCTKLFSKIISPLKFDDFLSLERLGDLRDNFGFSLEDEPESTLTGTCSGTFYGYPFVFTEDLDFAWGEKEWTGSITISYQEEITDSEGKKRWVTKTEVLTASITRPYPEFSQNRNFFFGHSASPNLSFSRTPSSLSGGSGLFNSLGKKYQMRQLRKFEQNLSDESQYTMVGNREFEVLFRSENRDNEVEFRMLYTPLAQQYMVSLLNDTAAGYGDDFSYTKSNCVTHICSEHLNKTSFSEPPFHTDHFDIRDIKKLFMEQSAEFFRSLYFTFAPLLLVPAYNEPRQDLPHEEGVPTVSPSEIEGAAYYCSNRFRPEESITENIFNIISFTPFPGGADAVVEAIGFAGVERTEYETRYGADGNYHDIPIHWVEYVPVSRQTSVRAWLEEFCQEGSSPFLRRRGILFF